MAILIKLSSACPSLASLMADGRPDKKGLRVGPPVITTIADVRSPAEFADDHLPGAVNLPVLDDDERAKEIGTMYKKISPFAAKRAGAALIAGNIARHISSALKDTDRNFRPLVVLARRSAQQRNGECSARSAGKLTSLTMGINAIANRCLMASIVCPNTLILSFCGGAPGLLKRIYRWPLARCTSR